MFSEAINSSISVRQFSPRQIAMNKTVMIDHKNFNSSIPHSVCNGYPTTFSLSVVCKIVIRLSSVRVHEYYGC